MFVVEETPERTTETPNAVMAGLAGPSQGAAELSTWRVRITDGNGTPVHAVTREQVWMPLSGQFEVTVGESVRRFAVGQAAVIGAGEVRRVTALGDAEALVAMPVDGRARVPGADSDVPLPWAQ